MQNQDSSSSSSSTPSPVATLAASAQQVAQNIVAGHCPLTTARKLFVYVLPVGRAGLLNSSGLFLQKSHEGISGYETADLLTLQSLTGGEYSYDKDNLLLSFETLTNTPAEAIPLMLNLATSRGKIPSYEVERLTVLYESWFHNRGWGECGISHGNAPSMGSWNGFPWESYNIMDRDGGLMHGVPYKRLDINSGSCAPTEHTMRWSESKLPKARFQLIWSAEGGIVDDVPGACTRAIEALVESKRRSKNPSKKRKPAASKVKKPPKSKKAKKTKAKTKAATTAKKKK